MYMANKHNFNLATFHDEIEESLASIPDLQLHDGLIDSFCGEEEKSFDADNPEEPMFGWDIE